MTGIEQLHSKNHVLYLRVQSMLNMRRSYDDICDDIGLVGSNRVNELCDWFIAYKSPKALPMVAGRVFDVPVRSSSSNHLRRLRMFERQREGVRAAMEDAGL